MGCALSTNTTESPTTATTTTTNTTSFVSVSALRNQNSTKSLLSAYSDDDSSENDTPFMIPTKPLTGLSFDSSDTQGGNDNKNDLIPPPSQATLESPSVTSKYSRIKTIGSGQYGVVYLAVDRVTGGMVAVKVVKPEQSNTTTCLCVEYDNLVRCKGYHGIVQV
eukprot:PhF_6_TR9247/c0_g1_i3/m.14624